MTTSSAAPAERRGECRHDSIRVDGGLDDHCLLCGADGYWHDGHAHFYVHPSGKLVVILRCQVPDAILPVAWMPASESTQRLDAAWREYHTTSWWRPVIKARAFRDWVATRDQHFGR